MVCTRAYSIIFLLVLALKCSHQDLIDHRGKDFIISFISQPPYINERGENIIYISTFEDVAVRIQVPFLLQDPSLQHQWDQQYNIKAGSVKEISLPGKTRMPASSITEKKGIRITANKPISVYARQNALEKGEGFLGLPVDVLRKDYIISTFFPRISAIVQVTAKEDNTHVSFKLKLTEGGAVDYDNKMYYSESVLSVILNDTDVVQLLGYGDLTGTIVTSSKPIAVFSGNDCTWVPSKPCNQLVEQLPPVDFWGENFITSPTPANPGGDEFHVVASKDKTDIYIDERFNNTLQKGEKLKINAPRDKALTISTTYPSLVVQYSSGRKAMPSMSVVPPMKWASNDYTVFVAGGKNAYDGYVNVVIATKLRGDVCVKGSLHNVASQCIKMNWVTLSGGFSRGSLHLNQTGVYHIFHDNPLANFTSMFYGKTAKNLFSFPTGLKWELEKSPSCSITSTSGGDKVDNDCDGVTDEELANGKDDDGDGTVDEDLATPVPNVTMPEDFVSPPLLACHQSSNVADPAKPGFHPIVGPYATRGVCALRGNATINHKGGLNGEPQGCRREIVRVWTVEDACQNKITHNQRIQIITPDEPVLTFRSDVTLFCRDEKYLAPRFTGEVVTDPDPCKRNVTITHKDKISGDCFNGQEKMLERTWLVKDKCRADIVKTQVIKLVPKGSKITTNYKTSFRITNEIFSSELTDRTSVGFKTLAANLEKDMESTFRTSKLGMFFVEAKVLDFRNGSVIAAMLVKIDMQAQVDQRQLLNVMNDTLSRGSLRRYQVDPSSLQLQDFDECRLSDLNKCHAKASCINTVGSYNCKCVDGYVGDGFLCQAPPSIHYSDPPIESGINENVTLKCHASGLPKPTFIWITPEGDVINASMRIIEIEILDDGSQNKRGKILQDDGSLLVFDTRVYDGGIYKCVAGNFLGKDERNVSLAVRKDIVEVDVAITLEDEVFDEQLENKSSVRYQEMEKKVEEELTALFKDIEGFERVEILGFVNGSVKVRFRVIVKVDKSGEKEPLVIAKKVGQTLRVNVENGKIGSLKVKRTIELREVPPPPVDLGSSDVTQTEAFITWSHPELYEMYSISGYSLQYKKFGTSKWAQFVFTGGVNHMLSNLEHDTAYLVRLKAENKFGKGIPSENLELKTKKKRSAAELALAIVLPLLALVILAILVAVIVYRRWKKKRKGYEATDEAVPMHPVVGVPQEEATNGRFLTFGHDRYAAIPGEAPNSASSTAAAASFSWREIARERVTLGKILGEGEFGMVLKGEFSEDDGRIVPCAVKKLKRAATESDFKDLLNELEIMTSVGNHPNLINLIGACSVGGPLMILVEFAEHGNLLRYLRDHRKQNYDNMNEYTLEISSAERLRIACDVSDGMMHLAAVKCAHRDLAARNVLLGEELVAKVSDFGLSRDIYTDNVYEKKTGGKLPAKWMAVESLEQGIYTSQSDVWSFGVLLWEIETGGCAPYAGMVVSELLDKLKEGSRLEKPRYCSDELYSVMLRCWNANPKKRPTFDELSDELHRMHRQGIEYLAPEDFKLDPNYVNTSVENVSSA